MSSLKNDLISTFDKHQVSFKEKETYSTSSSDTCDIKFSIQIENQDLEIDVDELISSIIGQSVIVRPY